MCINMVANSVQGSVMDVRRMMTEVRDSAHSRSLTGSPGSPIEDGPPAHVQIAGLQVQLQRERQRAAQRTPSEPSLLRQPRYSSDS